MWADTERVSYDVVCNSGCQALEMLGCERVEPDMRFARLLPGRSASNNGLMLFCDAVALGAASFEKLPRYQECVHFPIG